MAPTLDVLVLFIYKLLQVRRQKHLENNERPQKWMKLFCELFGIVVLPILEKLSLYHDENQNWIVVINQRFKKKASLFIMCPQPGRQTKKLQPR